MPVSMLQSLFCPKAWANTGLFGVLATVPAAADVHTALRTLNQP